MKQWLLTGYELLTVLAPCTMVYVLTRVRDKRCGQENGISVWQLALLLGYLFGMLHVTGAGTLSDVQWYGLEWNPAQVNLLPFSQGIDPTGYLLNIVLFLPLGVLLPAFCRKWDSVRCVAACGLLVSFVIELSQLLNNRRTDVDDLLLNALGAVLGLLLFRIVSYIFKRSAGQRNGCARDLMLCAAAAFVGRFLLFDEMGAAGRLFEFY